MTANKQGTKTRKKIPGRPPRNGGFSIMVRRGELPERRAYLRAFLTEIRAKIIEDLGPKESDLTGAQKILVDRVLSKLCVCRVVEESLKETGLLNRKGELKSVLGKHYLAFCNSIRLDLAALGIDKRAGNDILDPLALARTIDLEKDEPKDTEKQEIAPPSASQAQIPSDDGGA